MGRILSIEQLKELANNTVIEIPDFAGTGTIDVKVKKPNLMAMASQNKIPNHLIGIVNEKMFGQKAQKKQEENRVKDLGNLYRLYCEICLVEPAYDEFKEIITDEQMQAIFDWAMGDVGKLDSFRDDSKHGTSDNDEQEVPEKTE